MEDIKITPVLLKRFATIMHKMHITSFKCTQFEIVLGSDPTDELVDVTDLVHKQILPEMTNEQRQEALKIGGFRKPTNVNQGPDEMTIGVWRGQTHGG